MFVCYGLKLAAIALALKQLEVSRLRDLGRPGILSIAAIGVIWFQEPLTALKLASIGLIIACVVGLGFVGVGR